MEDKLASTVVKLDVDNYVTWCVEAEAHFVRAGLAGTLDGGDADPSRNRKAIAHLIALVKQHHYTTVKSHTTAKGAWDDLKSKYQAQTTARRLDLQRQINDIRLRSDETITRYFSRARDLVAQIKNAGGTFSDDQLLLALLNGLPPRVWFRRLCAAHDE